MQKEELVEKLQQLKVDDTGNADVFKKWKDLLRNEKSEKNNMWMKILSVVIAVLIWLFVASCKRSGRYHEEVLQYSCKGYE